MAFVRRFRRSTKPAVKRVSSKDVEEMLAKKVLRLERTIRLRKPEEKFIETSMSAINVTDLSGYVQSLVVVAQGTDYNNRIGDSIRVHRIQGHARISTASSSLGAAPNGEEFIRMHVVLDTQQISDTVPGASTIFASTAGPSVLLNEALSHHRFKILKTSPLMVAARLASSSTPVATLLNQAPTQNAVWNFNIKCNHVVSYNATTGDQIEKNGIYFVFLTSIAADTMDADGIVRVYYTDC